MFAAGSHEMRSGERRMGASPDNRRECTGMTFRYVAHHRVLDYARLGWSIADTLEHCHHGEYSILMVWMCPCAMVEPKQ